MKIKIGNIITWNSYYETVLILNDYPITLCDLTKIPNGYSESKFTWKYNLTTEGLEIIKIVTDIFQLEE